MKNRIAIVIWVWILLLPAISSIHGQDIQYVRRQLDRLCSPEFHGRAYYKKGDSLAADYLADQFKEHSLGKFNSDYFQTYSFGVNILEKVTFSINEVELEFGKDFMMNASSGSLNGKFKPILINASLMKRPRELISTLLDNVSGSVIMLDSLGLNNPELYRLVRTLAMEGQLGIIGLIEICPKTPIGLVGRKPLPVPHIQLNRESLPSVPKQVEIQIENRFEDNYSTRNVIGYIPGLTDRYIVFTAHYDMCGSFGEGNYFPGASDNGSGTAMVLDLARHFKSGKKPYYSVAFMLFSGEEAGLLGSTHYVDNPSFPLDKIKLVINLDMVGTGQEGAILFNGKARPAEAAIVQKLNEQKHYLKEVEERGPAANSDHHPFHVKDIPAIFFLTKGPSGGGHSIDDTVDKLPLYAYENLFKLVLDITRELEKQESGR